MASDDTRPYGKLDLFLVAVTLAVFGLLVLILMRDRAIGPGGEAADGGKPGQPRLVLLKEEPPR